MARRSVTDAPVVGMYFGSTYSSVAIYKDEGKKGKARVILNMEGNDTTPSYVAFTDEGRLVGDAAKRHWSMDPANTIYGVKNFLGRKYEDPELQEIIARATFQIDCDDNGYPIFKVEEKGKDAIYTPQEICAMILANLKKTAEAVLGKTVSEVIMTVPAYFDQKQCLALIDSAAYAGLDAKLVEEPIAAALHHGLQGNRNILVINVGTNEFDVTVMTSNSNEFVIETAVFDFTMGSNFFDVHVAKHLIDTFNKIEQIDLSCNQKAEVKLITACQEARKELTKSKETEICLKVGNTNFRTSMTESKFSGLTVDLMLKMAKLVKKTMLDSGIEQNDITDVICVGEATDLPILFLSFKDIFGERILASNDPKLIPVYGVTQSRKNIMKYIKEVQREENDNKFYKETLYDITNPIDEDNEKQAKKCLKIAEDAIRNKNYFKAERFLNKCLKFNPDLLEPVEVLRNKIPGVTSSSTVRLNGYQPRKEILLNRLKFDEELRNKIHDVKNEKEPEQSDSDDSNTSDSFVENATDSDPQPNTSRKCTEEQIKAVKSVNIHGKDVYEVLGIPKNTPDNVVREKLRELILTLHSDKTNVEGAVDAFIIVKKMLDQFRKLKKQK